ncbi:MAG: hypothetical protein WA208_18645 [Thermoanaerobaculia bacterium]
MPKAPRNNPEVELRAALEWAFEKCYTPELRNRDEAHWFTEWITMLSRCYNPADPGYAYEGAHGITVADAWNPEAGGSFATYYRDVKKRRSRR